MLCTKCGGNGYISKFMKIENGKCFRCRGSGKEPTFPRNDLALKMETRIGNTRFKMQSESRTINGRKRQEYIITVTDAAGIPVTVKCKTYGEAKARYSSLIREKKEEFVALKNI